MYITAAILTALVYTGIAAYFSRNDNNQTDDYVMMSLVIIVFSALWFITVAMIVVIGLLVLAFKGLNKLFKGEIKFTLDKDV